ncbi:MAG: hypothetical protein ACJ8M1_03930 [Chthoniobacterales bacterium]
MQRRLLLFLSLTSFIGVLPLRAQDAAQPAVDVPAGAVEQTPAPPPELPSATPQLPELSALDQAFNQTSLGKESDELRTRVALRDLQNQVERDQDVISAKDAAASARTDLEKRERLREYYQLKYNLMSAKASNAGLKTAVARAKQEHIGQLAQPRVRPSGNEAPAPAATPKKKKKKRSGKHF